MWFNNYFSAVRTSNLQAGGGEGRKGGMGRAGGKKWGGRERGREGCVTSNYVLK